MSTQDFWSRRKAAVEQEALAEEVAIAEAQQQAEETALAERPDEEILAELGLCAPEQLDSAEQVREFLASAVPARLRSRALRRLWGLNPVLANLDGLVDYGEDYTDAATVIENMQTVYQVGKGMFDKVLEQEKRDAEQSEAAAMALQDTAEDDADDPKDAEESEVVADAAPEASDTDLATAHHDDTYEPELRPVPTRRMRFEFETAT